MVWVGRGRVAKPKNPGPTKEGGGVVEKVPENECGEGGSNLGA